MPTELGGEYVLVSGLLDRISDKKALLEDIGKFLVAESERAFAKQQLGEYRWPQRYPGQPEPFIHVAGALADLSRSATVKERWFARRPALEYSGMMARSLSYRPVADDTVQVGIGSGPAAAYAGKHQQCGISRQPVTPEALANLAKVMKTARKHAKSQRLRKGETGEKRTERLGAASARLQALKKLGFLFQRKELVTKIVQRPFVGITDQARGQLHKIVVAFFSGEAV